MRLSNSFKGVDPLLEAISFHLNGIMLEHTDAKKTLDVVTNTVLDVLDQNKLIPRTNSQIPACNRLVKTVLDDLFSIMNKDVQRLVASDPEDEKYRRELYADEGKQIKEDMEEGYLWGTLSDSDRKGVARIITNQTLQRAADSTLRYDLTLAAKMGTALADKNAIQPVYDFMRKISKDFSKHQPIYGIAEKEWVSFCKSSEDPSDPTSPEVKRDIQDTIVHATCTAVCEYLVDKTIVAIALKIDQGMDGSPQKKGQDPNPEL